MFTQQSEFFQDTELPTCDNMLVDPLSIGAATAGFVSLSLQLLSGCVKGFVLLTTAHNLGKDASTIVCMLNLQEVQLIEWARRAGLLTGAGSVDPRLNQAAVEVTLRQIEQLLQNTENLKTRYGLSLMQQKYDGYQTTAVQDPSKSDKSVIFTSISQDTRDDILRRAGDAQKTNLMKRLWWAAVDKEKIEHLVTDVHFLIRELWNLINPLQHDDITNSLEAVLSNVIELTDKVEPLVTIKDSLIAIVQRLEAKTEQDIQQDLRGLASTAELKAAQVALTHTEPRSDAANYPDVPTRRELLKQLDRLSIRNLNSFRPMAKDNSRGLAVYDGDDVFVEWKDIDPSMRSKLLPRAENLATLLSIPKARTFQSLTCRGLLEDDQRLGFVYQHPLTIRPPQEPKSLLDLFSAKGGIESPSLSDRIRLALRIVQVVRSFHRTSWLHKGLRSENILFFNVSDVDAAVHEADFVLAGFNFARLGAPTEISEQPSANPKHDIYRHPKALGTPSESFNMSMDVYSLGTILLEIAEWQPLWFLVESIVGKDAKDVSVDKLAKVQQFLLNGKGKRGTTRLWSRAGDLYASACLMCLNGSVETGELEDGDEIEQRSVLDVVVERLQSCRV